MSQAAERVEQELTKANIKGERLTAWVRAIFFGLAMLLSVSWEWLGGRWGAGGQWLFLFFSSLLVASVVVLITSYRLPYRRWVSWATIALDVIAYNAPAWTSAIGDTPGSSRSLLTASIPMAFGGFLAVAAGAVRQIRWAAVVSGGLVVVGWTVTLLAISDRTEGFSDSELAMASLPMWLSRFIFFASAAVLVAVAGVNALKMARAAAETRAEFGRFVGERVATQALAHSMTAQTRPITVLFTDLRNFTSFSENLAPEQVLAHLSEHFQIIVPIVEKNGGAVVKFIGDAIMATFGAPQHLENHATSAVRAGIEMIQAMDRVNADHRARGLSELHMGVGIATGPVVVGELSGSDRTEYAVIGDTVNTASRLEGLNKEMKTHLLLTAATRDALHGEIVTRALGAMPVKGKAQPVEVFTVEGV
jgi:class 3 adenylate cyclase